MKKAVKVTLGIVVGVIIIGAIASNSNSNTQSVPNSNSTNTQQAEQPAAEKMTIKNSTYKEGSYGSKEVVGEITNNDTAKHSATIKATFYAADGSIKGTAVGVVNDVAPGETKTFTLMTGDDVAGYKDLKVQVDTLL